MCPLAKNLGGQASSWPFFWGGGGGPQNGRHLKGHQYTIQPG